MNKLEIIVQSLHDAIIAEEAGATQLDLKANYIQGGVTTSAGMIEAVCNSVSIPVLVMIHPPNPVFCYSKSDLKIITSDIRLARTVGARHFLIGCINSNKQIDTIALQHIQNAAEDAHLHFNLVWQLTTQPYTALDVLIQNNIHSIRSSGRGFLGDHAVDHLNELKEINAHINNRMQVFAAGGVNQDNIPLIASKTGISNFHTGSGARKPAQPFGAVQRKSVAELHKVIDMLNH